MILAVALALACTVTDGDTIRCGDERIRLSGIDAPELHGCPKYRRCVEGDGQAARRALAQAMRGQALTIERLGTDRYGRTIGVVRAGRVNLSCRMIELGQAEYVARWDNGGMVARDCPATAR